MNKEKMVRDASEKLKPLLAAMERATQSLLDYAQLEDPNQLKIEHVVDLCSTLFVLSELMGANSEEFTVSCLLNAEDALQGFTGTMDQLYEAYQNDGNDEEESKKNAIRDWYTYMKQDGPS